MLKSVQFILFIIIVFSIYIKTLAQDDPIKVELRANKTEYICGEPVLMKTTVINTSKDICILNQYGYQWGQDSFTMSVAYNSNEYVDIFSVMGSRGGREGRRLGIRISPIQSRRSLPYYISTYIPGSLEGNQRAEMTDLIYVPEPGDYKFKSVLKDYAGKVKTYESEPVSFKVLSLKERKDSISQFGDPNLITIKLGKTIYYAHYAQNFGSGPMPEDPINQEEFEKIAPEIIKNHKDSVFREYVLYADIMAHGNKKNQYRNLPEKYKQQAMEFAKEYPDSWLLPTLYHRLSETFIYEKDFDKADEYVDKSMELAPNASFLGAGAGHAKIDRIRQRTENAITAQVQAPPVPVTLPKKKPLGIALPIAGAAVAVIVVAGLVLFSRKKKLKKAE